MIMGSMPVGERVSTQNSHLLYETQLFLDQCTSTFLARPQTQIDAIRAGILHNEAWKAFNLSESLDWSGLSRSLVQIATGVSEVVPQGRKNLTQSCVLNKRRSKTYPALF
jgi:hypothetical protein